MLLIFSKSKITQSVLMTVGSLITFSLKIIKILFLIFFGRLFLCVVITVYARNCVDNIWSLRGRILL